MTGECSYCKGQDGHPTLFDTHDGGRMCILCKKAACPACEGTIYTDKEVTASSPTGQPVVKHEHSEICDACKERMKGG